MFLIVYTTVGQKVTLQYRCFRLFVSRFNTSSQNVIVMLSHIVCTYSPPHLRHLSYLLIEGHVLRCQPSWSKCFRPAVIFPLIRHVNVFC